MTEPAPRPVPQGRPARRSFAAAGIIVGITLLLARCGPTITAAPSPSSPLPVVSGGPGDGGIEGTPDKLPVGEDRPPGEGPPPVRGAESTGDTRGNGSPPPTDRDAGGRDGQPTTTVSQAGPVESSFCRQLGMFSQPIRELRSTSAGAIPAEIGDEVERISAGYRDDPDFERHGGADDMRVIWEWAARVCTEPMVGNPPRFRLIQFEDQLAGQGPIDVCVTLSAAVVEAGLSEVTNAKVTSSKAAATRVSNRCTYKISVGSTATAELTVAVDDRWGILEGSCVEGNRGQEVTQAPADRACLVSSPMNGQFQLYLEQRSRTVSIELRWPTRDAQPLSPDDGRQVVEKLYVSIAPTVVLGREGQP